MYLPPGPDLAWKGQYISLPAATLKAPVEGNRTVPVEITWLRDGTPPSYAVVFNAREQRVTPITQIAAVHISNIHSAVPVRLLFPDTGFEIELGSNLEGYYPVVTNGLEFVAYTPLTPSGSDGVTIQVLNFLPPPLVFGLSPGGTVAGVSRIDTAAPLAGGPITSSGNISLNVPLAIQYGGTGAVTPDLAMDALAETGGSTVGLLSRNAAGNWVMQPLAAAGPPALPVSILNGGSGATTGFLALDNLSAAGSQTGVLQRVAGGNWSLSTAGTGTITGVTAGPGLSGGGGSGVVTLGLSIPVSYANGGTNATTRNGAMDSLTTASGADAGILTRSAAGNWGLDLGGLDIANGGTGAVTAPAALTALGALPLAGGTMTGALAGTSHTLTTPLGLASGGTGAATAPLALTALGAVAKAGDTMTGNLSIINPVGFSVLVLDAPAGNASQVLGRKAGKQRWEMDFGNTTAETGGNLGSDFGIVRYSDTETYIDAPLFISRATGNAVFNSLLTAPNINVNTNLQTPNLSAPVGTNITITAVNSVFVGNVAPNGDNSHACGFPGLSWNQCSAYAFPNPSDPRLKSDMRPSAAGALGVVEAVAVHEFTYATDPAQRRHTGFDASQIKELHPNAFVQGEDEDKTQAVNLPDMIAVLWQAVQELSAQVAALHPPATAQAATQHSPNNKGKHK